VLSKWGRANGLLAKFGLGVEDLLAEVPSLGDDDVLLLIGSVSDGLATPLSDIDMMVAGDRRPDTDLVMRESDRERAIRRLESGHEINVEYWSWDRLRKIETKFSEAVHAINNPNLTDEIFVFDDGEARIIHYVINGITLAGDDFVLKEMFDRDSFADYLVMYSITRYFATAEDSIGQAMQGDIACASFDLRRAFEMLAGAEIASLGYTHPGVRWRVKLLEEIKPEIGNDVYDEYMSYLFCGPDQGNQEIEAGLKFAQSRLGAIFMRRPKVFAAAGALSERMKFVTSFEA
jgi:predicted nucleotidyltransferase